MLIDKGAATQKVTNAILYMIAKTNLPLSIVENEGFRYLMKTAVPLYTIPSRRTITRLMNEKYDVLKNRFKSNLKQDVSYTLTCDIWTDVSNQSYLGVTLHYLKEEIVLTNATVGVFPLNTNHTADYISNTLLSILDSFNIDSNRIVAVVSDSASNMTGAVSDAFGSRKHLPCFAHALSHLVPDAMKVLPRVEDIIAKVKSIVTLTKRSVVASDELKKLQKRDGKTDGTVLMFKQEVPTRWNSKLYMIERFLVLRDYVYPILLKCPSAPEMLTREEFEVLDDIVKILQPIENVITEISGDTYPTCSLIIPIIHCMVATIQKCIPQTVEGTALKEAILLQVRRRFKDVELYQTLAIATILDPRFKKLHFQDLRAASSTITQINNMTATMKQNFDTNNEAQISVDKTTSFGLWAFHDSLVAASTPPRDDPGGIDVELRQYLNQSVISRNTNPFQYWQTLKYAYPTLFRIAMKYLSVVATSVPSERLFSKAGVIKSDLRNRLTGEKLNALLFLGSLSKEDWVLA